MKAGQLTQTPLSEFANDERWQLAQRIVASPPFLRSARLRTFLLYVTEQSLAGNAGALHEHDIGCAIFNREPCYNPVDDNIVRVYARQLRLRLDTYFQTVGKDEKLEIVIPKGTYVPNFPARDAVPSKQEDDEAERDMRIAEAFPKTAIPNRLPWILCGLLALISITLGVRVWLPTAGTPNRPPTRQAVPPSLLAAVMDPGRPTIVVAPDSGIPIYSDLFGRTVSLNDYLTVGFPESLLPPQTDPFTRRMFELLDRRSMVTFSTAVAMSRLVAAAEKNGWRLHLRFAHQMNAREFDEGNFILIGNSAANPWSGLYEKTLNFRTTWDPDASRTIFRNQSPRAGEIPAYEAKRAGHQVVDSYAVIALIRRQTGERRSNILILGGLDSESTEAATEFVCDNRHNRDSEALVNPGGPPFELLLDLHSTGGAIGESKIVASRQ